MKKFLIVCLITLLMGGMLTPPAYADLVVYDPSAVAQMIQNVTNTLQQIQLMQQNLQSMDAVTAAANITQIQQSLAQLQALQQQVQGMVLNYSQMQQQFDATYKDFGTINGMSATDYASQAASLITAMQNQTKDAMTAQGLVSYIPSQANNLNQQLTASQNAQGALAAAQAGNQIAGIMTQQLMMLQQMIGQANQLQATYIAQQADQAAKAKAASDKFFGGTVQENPLQQDSQGSGVGHY